MIARATAPAARLAARALAALVCALLGASALAQDVPAQLEPPAQLPAQEAPAPGTPAAPQYQVEVLIFAHRDFDRSEEQFSHEAGAGEPAPRQALRAPPVFDDTNFGPLAQNPPLGGPAAPGVEPPLPGLATGGELVEPNEFRFRLLRPEELQLTNQYRVISRNAQAYTALLHGGWVQPGLSESDAKPFDLAMLGATNPVGTIRLYLSRFLHVDLDLSYQDSSAVASAPSSPAAPNELAEVPIAPRYHLSADRPTRSGELHYFDHPAFGVLIKVTPVRPDPAAPGAPGTRPAA
jgi:hypothetical protein